MTTYGIKVKENKSWAKCRLCHANMEPGTVCVEIKVESFNDYGGNTFLVHRSCLLKKIITEGQVLEAKRVKELIKKYQKELKVLTDGKS